MVRPYVSRDGEGEALWFLGNLVTLKTTGARPAAARHAIEILGPPPHLPAPESLA